MDVKNLPSYVYELLTKIAHENAFTGYSVHVNNCSLPGDGFASELFRITISETKTDKRLDLVCKVAPANKKRREEFFSNVLFNNEALLYTKLMPTFAKFQENKNLSAHDQFLAYPKCYGTIIDDENERYVIILEDLRPLGFQMWNKAKPTPIENARLTMCELGKFHGLSFAMKDQRPDEFAEITQMRNIFREAFQTEKTRDMFINVLDYAILMLKNEEHKSIMIHVKNNITRYAENCFDDRASDRFGVLCHGLRFTQFFDLQFCYLHSIELIQFSGDCWNNNMLYRLNEQVNRVLNISWC